MNLDANKVIQELLNEIARLNLENAKLKVVYQDSLIEKEGEE